MQTATRGAWSEHVLSGHTPVLLEEAVRAVLGDRAGLYVDATFGRGGHTRRLLGELAPGARVLVVDRDADAIACAESLAREDPRVRVRRGPFGALDRYIADAGGGPASGILFDIGVSSPQLDEPARGFSFAADGPLDMRMDQREALTAADWLNSAREHEVADVIRRYGEDFHARRLARRIVAARPLATTGELAAAIGLATGASGGPGNPAAIRAGARVFQAVRIHVNDELGELERGLDAAFAALGTGGRMAVITFHGLEHRLVRRRFRHWVEGPDLPRRLPVRGTGQRVARRIDAVGKGLRPRPAEIVDNPRARSALLQAVEKTVPETGR